jgi:hypothetical protein
MINATMNHLATQLNQYFKNNFQLVEDIVVVSNLMELDGSVAPNANNKLVLVLVNIEKDSMPYQSGSPKRSNDQRQLAYSAPLFLNLYVMMAANFGAGNYAEALKTISNAIGFFQQQAVFDQINSPGLDTRIEKIILDIENLKIPDLNNLWSLLGGKYLPSVFYKVRMISMQSSGVIAQVPVITNPSAEVTRSNETEAS